MAFVNVVFSEFNYVYSQLVGEIDPIGFESHRCTFAYEIRCREILDALYKLQNDKLDPGFQRKQSQLLQKLLAMLWQREGEVDYPVLFFGAAQDFAQSYEKTFRFSKTTHFTLLVGSYYSCGRNYFDKGDYVVEYLCLYAFQDIAVPTSSKKALDQALFMSDVAVRYLQEQRGVYGDQRDLSYIPYHEDFPEPTLANIESKYLDD